MAKKNIWFRSWYYFRTGWSTYFAFILAAINTLTVTYFLAIDNYPILKAVFPSFEQYIVIIVSIGVPLLVLIGFVHFKRTQAFKSEVDVLIESNPYQRRNTVNGEINLRLNLKILTMMLKISKKESFSESEIQEIRELSDEIKNLSEKRNIKNNLDMDFIKNEVFKT
uniref:Uncharacterized protein n=1 Tax=uncultured marine thaumarchaeote KM3_82_A11 TaxID=1456301 RepID=A0A075HNW3_9ARCH|nr:hypothetical protein [uncultured marine thaumarchaeote KM3_82_A11]